MPPKQIRSEMVLRGVTNAQIAKETGFDRTLVSKVIYGERANSVVQKKIAVRIGRRLREVFPTPQLRMAA